MLLSTIVVFAEHMLVVPVVLLKRLGNWDCLTLAEIWARGRQSSAGVLLLAFRCLRRRPRQIEVLLLLLLAVCP